MRLEKKIENIFYSAVKTNPENLKKQKFGISGYQRFFVIRV